MGKELVFCNEHVKHTDQIYDVLKMESGH